ncbi:MAG TPA: acyloxyacyl hydrolase [Gemmataceae bacterium]|nr:acyloxyacyl hydrolase [Gemmataceae bacterium]
MMARARAIGMLVLFVGLLPVTTLRAQVDGDGVPEYPLAASLPRAVKMPLPVTFGANDTPAEQPHPILQKFDVNPPQESAEQAQVKLPEDQPAFDPTSPAMSVFCDPQYCMTDRFPAGQWAVQYVTSVLFTPYLFGVPVQIYQTPMNLLMENVRFSRVIRGNDPNRFLRGSSEFVVELHTVPILSGPGSIIIGGAVYGRYNFSFTKRERLVFYLQGGGGCMYSDSYLSPNASLVSAFNFIIHIGGGCHYFLSPSFSLDLESSFYHYSNGGIVMPNISVNGAMEFIGFTYYFGRN